MNLVTINQNNNTLKMTSLQIAEMLGKRHDTVRTSIERLIDKGIIIQPSMTDVQILDTMGRSRNAQVYVFEDEQGERDSIVVVARLSPEFTGKLVDRWRELEKQVAAPQLPNFNNPVEAARAWANEVEQKQLVIEQVVVLEEQNAVLTPKGQFFDTVAKSNALQSVSEVAKKQGISAQALNKVLRSINIYDNRYPRKNIFKDKVIQQADGKVVLDKSGRSVSMFTNKGEINIVNNFLYTDRAVKIVEDHYHNDDKKLKTYRANLEARRTPKEINTARIEHTQNTIKTINNLLH